MGIASDHIIDINKLNGGGDAVKGLYFGGSAQQAYLGGDLVFNRALYLLDVPSELAVEATGGTWESLLSIAIISNKTDRDGVQTQVDYILPEGDGIAPNPNEYELTGTYEIRQKVSGLKVTGVWKQEKKVFLHYSVNQIWSVVPSYENIGAGGGKAAPSVNVTVWMNAHWSDGAVTTEYKSYLGTVTSATGKQVNSSGATIEKSTGVVSANGLGVTETDERNVFNVETLAGTVYVEASDETLSWSWSGTSGVTQLENKKHSYGTPTYTLTSAVSATELEPVDTSVKVTGTAVKTSYYYYDSDPSDIKSANTDETLYVLLDNNVNDARQMKGADASTTFNVGVNTSIDSARTFKIRVYNTGLGYDKTHTVKQNKNTMTTYWTSAALNGSVMVENVLADGTGQPVLVPIVQKKYGRLEGVSTDTLLETYTKSVSATAIGGTPASGTGATFSDGHIKANSLGRTETTAARTIYTLTSVKVTGADGKSYTLTLPSAVTVKQNKNTRYAVSQGYVLSVSADPTSGISNLGDSSTITASAREKYSITFDADATATTEYTNVSATLSTNLGTLSKTSITGTGQTAKLTLGENVKAVRTATITLTKGSVSKTCTVSQNAVSYVLTEGEDQECNATASVVYVTFKSSRNGKVLEPQFTANLQGVTLGTATLNGTTYTIPVNIPENTSYEMRTIIVTATQTRHDGNKAATVNIIQAAAAKPSLPAMNVYGYGSYANAAKTSVSVTLVFDASNESKYDGGKVTGVYAWLSNEDDGTGKTVGSGQDVGDVSVSQGSRTTKSLTFSGTSGYAELFLYIRYDTSKTFVVQIEGYEPEG